MRTRGILALVAVFVLVAAAYWLMPAKQANTAGDAGGKGGARGAQAATVATAVARIADLPIRLRAIGWVAPVAKVTISARLNSQIAEQRVVEGQLVAKGDILFRLDDREVRAAIARDTANLARDQAVAARTQADLKRGHDLVA